MYSRTLYGHVAGRMFAGLSSHPASDVVDPSLQQSCSSLQSFILASQTPEHEPTGRHRAKLPDPMNPRPNFSSNSVENESGPRETAPVLRAPAGAQGANAPGRVDVVIITLDEELNLPHCLASLQGWTRDVFVVDSGSTDRTRSLAEELGALFTHQDWLGYAKQRNWAIENLPLTAPWTLVLDADEVISNALRKEIERRVELPPQEVAENGFFINRLSYFLDQPIRHCGYFPSWNMRLFKRGRALYERRLVHEHMVIDHPVGYLASPMLHRDRRGLDHFYAKHNRYSTLEAVELYNEVRGVNNDEPRANLPDDARRRRWLKRNVMQWLPWPGLWRFAYMFFARRGFLDGVAGYRFCMFIAAYDSMVAMKLRAARRSADGRRLWSQTNFTLVRIEFRETDIARTGPTDRRDF